MTDIREAQFVARNSEGGYSRRPVSPHLSIYRWPITMVSSILNRVTGIALCVGTLFLACWLSTAATSAAAFDQVQGFAGSWLGQLMLFGWTASLFYHLFAGLRHLAWDMGKGFAKPGLNATSWLVLGVTLVATIATWVAGYIAWEG